MFRQLLNYVNNYLNGYCTLKDLQTWLLSNLQRILESGDEAAEKVANQIDADLVELGEGLVDEAGVRERIESYARFGETILLAFSEVEHHTATHVTTAAETLREQLEALGPVVDLHWAHKFA